MKHEFTLVREQVGELMHVSATCSCGWNGGTVRPVKPGRTLDEIEAAVLARHEDWRATPAVQAFEAEFGELDKTAQERVEAAVEAQKVAPMTLAEAQASAGLSSRSEASRGEIEKRVKAEGLPSLWAGADARLAAAEKGLAEK